MFDVFFTKNEKTHSIGARFKKRSISLVNAESLPGLFAYSHLNGVQWDLLKKGNTAKNFPQLIGQRPK
jgi:hypothetical protein